MERNHLSVPVPSISRRPWAGSIESARAGWLRRHRYPILLAAVAVDVPLLFGWADVRASLPVAEFLGPLFAILALAAGLLAGAALGLAAGLTLGAAFIVFAAPLTPAPYHWTAVAAALTWSFVALGAGVVAESRWAGWAAGGTPAGPRLVIPLPAGSAAEMRASLRAMLRGDEAGEELIEDVVLAAQEAFNNAVVRSAAVDVAASLCRGSIWIQVRDEGRGFDPAALPCTPDLVAEHGRGLYLMHEVMDLVHIDSGSAGTTVRMTKAVRLCDACERPLPGCPQPHASVGQPAVADVLG